MWPRNGDATGRYAAWRDAEKGGYAIYRVDAIGMNPEGRQERVYTTNAGDPRRRRCTGWYKSLSRASLRTSSARPGRACPILSKASWRPL
jgi:hypothetical protein